MNIMNIIKVIRNNLILIIILIILFIITLILGLYSKKNSQQSKNKLSITFKLYNMQNELLNNTDWEYGEQLLLEKYLNKNDNILQLGGNIGGSCIMAGKILDKNSINICVEPNKEIINTLQKNKKYTNSNYKIIDGAISDKNNLKLSTTSETINNNYVGSSVSNEGNIDIKSYPLKSIANIEKINVLFVDCEGCLESFIDEYEYFLKQIRLVIFEADQPHLCDYDKIKNILRKNNFKEIESGFFNVWIKN